MHSEAMAYLQRTIPRVDGIGKVILEIGSYNVNGSVRDLFTLSKWYDGVDMRAGPGVDRVLNAHEIRPTGDYDVVVTTETLEHDPDPKGIVDVAWGALVPGGYLVLTAASTGRHAHSVNGDQAFQPDEHYANIDPDMLREWLKDWVEVEVEYQINPGDVYAIARKPANGVS